MRQKPIGTGLSFVGALVGAIYIAMMLGCYAHECLGHGLGAILVGGSFRVFAVEADAHGRALYTGVPPELGWIPLWSGIAVNLLVGLLTVGVLRLRTFSSIHARLALVALAATHTGQAIGYSLQGALSGAGDAASLAREVHGLPHVVVVCALAASYLLLIHWSIGRFVGFVDEQFRPTDPRMRRRWFAATVVLPVAILIVARPASAVFTPTVDWASRVAIFVVVSVWSGVRCRAPMPPEGLEPRIGWRGATGWLAGAAAVATVAVLWSSKGVHVEW